MDTATTERAEPLYHTENRERPQLPLGLSCWRRRKRQRPFRVPTQKKGPYRIQCPCNRGLICVTDSLRVVWTWGFMGFGWSVCGLEDELESSGY